jgi:hypothetical protein
LDALVALQVSCVCKLAAGENSLYGLIGKKRAVPGKRDELIASPSEFGENPYFSVA